MAENKEGRVGSKEEEGEENMREVDKKEKRKNGG